MSARGRLLLIETATRHAVVGLAERDGTLVAGDEWESPHRHGEELLLHVDRLLAGASVRRADIAAVAVGTGPGSFTGLRIGLATAKTIAYSLACPIVGLPTLRSLALAAGRHEPGTFGLLLPAGVGDRYLARYAIGQGLARELQPPTLLPAADLRGAVPAGDRLVAFDLEPEEVGEEACERGRRAHSDLAAVLASEAAAHLAGGDTADLAALVPHYVALPRGVGASAEQMAWSPDLR